MKDWQHTVAANTCPPNGRKAENGADRECEHRYVHVYGVKLNLVPVATCTVVSINFEISAHSVGHVSCGRAAIVTQIQDLLRYRAPVNSSSATFSMHHQAPQKLTLSVAEEKHVLLVNLSQPFVEAAE